MLYCSQSHYLLCAPLMLCQAIAIKCLTHCQHCQHYQHCQLSGFYSVCFAHWNCTLATVALIQSLPNSHRLCLEKCFLCLTLFFGSLWLSWADSPVPTYLHWQTTSPALLAVVALMSCLSGLSMPLILFLGSFSLFPDISVSAQRLRPAVLSLLWPLFPTFLCKSFSEYVFLVKLKVMIFAANNSLFGANDYLIDCKAIYNDYYWHNSSPKVSDKKHFW